MQSAKELLFNFAVNIFKMKYLLLVLILSIGFISCSQDQWWNNENDSTVVIPKNKEGKVTVKKNIKLEKMIDFKGTTIPPAYAPQIDGYRVQLFFDSDKSKVNQARATFLSAFPKEDTYTEFKAPNFHLKVGNFRTQLDAERMKAHLISYFPTCIVVPEKVYFPKVN